MLVARERNVLVRVDVCKRIGVGTSSAVIGIARKLSAGNSREVRLHGTLASRRVGTEPGAVARRGSRNTLEVVAGVGRVGLGGSSGGHELALASGRASDVCRSLVEGGGKLGLGEPAADVGCGGLVEAGVEVDDLVLGVDEVEVGTRLNLIGVASRQGEIVRLAHYNDSIRGDQ